MLRKNILRLFIFIVGCALGIAFFPFLWEITPFTSLAWTHSNLVNGLVGGILLLIIELILEHKILRKLVQVEQEVGKKSLSNLLVNVIGMVLGLIIGALLSIPLYRMNIDVVDNILPAAIMLLFAYIGYHLTQNRLDEVKKIMTHKNNHNQMNHFKPYKILDTNVIIDGRIYEIAKSGFLEGTLLIPKFVLYELQYIADSSDNLKRVRGRRGLDILNSLQQEKNIQVEMYEHDFDDIDEVDTKLIYLAKKVNGAIVTNDYNLNKVSEFQSVEVLNINELANAVKPVVLPGEKMTVTIVKPGTEREQGVAYLNDGTMIVVEDGVKYLNQEVEVYVTSSLQTSAGRMIFAKIL